MQGTPAQEFVSLSAVNIIHTQITTIPSTSYTIVIHGIDIKQISPSNESQ